MPPITPSTSRSGSPKDRYYTNKFEFSDLVLSWTLEDIKAAGTETDCIPLLPKYEIKDRAEYFNRFKPLIIAETKGELKSGFEGIATGKTKATILKLSKVIASKNKVSPTTIIFQGDHLDEFGFANDVVLIEHPKTKQMYLGITCRKGDQESENTELVIKTKSINANDPQCKKEFAEDSKWNVYVLGSLITQMREYDVCQIQPKLSFDENFISGIAKNSNYSLSVSIKPIGFNQSQIKTIEDFANLQKGLQILQGPPGTGKTTTIVKLIETLVARRERVLVCAPSNKAVQVLAARFLRDCPDVQMVLAGRHDKLTDELKPIFIDDYKYQLSDMANVMQIIKAQFEVADKLDVNAKVDLKKQFQMVKSLLGKFEVILHKLKYFHIVADFDSDFKKVSAEAFKAVNSFNILAAFQSKEQFIENIKLLNSTVASFYGAAKRVQDPDLLQLNGANVIFCTLSVAGRSRMKQMDKVSTLIVDEAAQATEVDTIIPFQHFPSKCLLVGDTKQLPAVVTSDLAKKCHLDWSMMHRLVEELKYPHNMLDVQYRMHATIRSWPSTRFYNNKLNDGANITNRANLGLPKEFEPYAFVNVAYTEQKNGKSFMNRAEAKFTVSTLKYLQKKGIDVSNQVGIITFYAGQVDCLKQELSNAGIKNVQPQTVDGFQGDEKDIILISFVRANTRRSIGFLGDFRRLNVAITRAKHALVMVGNSKTLQCDDNLKALLANAKNRNCVYEAGNVEAKYWPSAKKPVVAASKPAAPLVVQFKSQVAAKQQSQSKEAGAPSSKKNSVQKLNVG